MSIEVGLRKELTLSLFFLFVVASVCVVLLVPTEYPWHHVVPLLVNIQVLQILLQSLKPFSKNRLSETTHQPNSLACGMIHHTYPQPLTVWIEQTTWHYKYPRGHLSFLRSIKWHVKFLIAFSISFIVTISFRFSSTPQSSNGGH